MILIPLSVLLREGGVKRRTAYRSGRRELIGYDLPKVKIKPKRRPPTEKIGRLIARTPLASRTRWRKW